MQSAIEQTLRAVVPPVLLANFRWDAYLKADAVIVLTDWEAEIVQMLFGPPVGRVSVVPNGVEPEFFSVPDRSAPRAGELVCTATITERKRVMELARAALAAGTPLRILGAPYAATDAYYRDFLALVQSAGGLIRYEGAVTDRTALAGVYRQARGFVLLSTMESLSLSALEAAASGCPLLLSDLPWARGTFGDKAGYCPVALSTAETAARLRRFYDEAPRLPVPPPPCGWDAVASQLVHIYDRVRQTHPHPQ
jgi:glycosyltransferase involved in cell wall biosynthesis